MKTSLIFFLFAFSLDVFSQASCHSRAMQGKQQFNSLLPSYPKAHFFAPAGSSIEQDFLERIKNTLQDWEKITRFNLSDVDINFVFGDFGYDTIAAVCHLTTTVLINSVRWRKISIDGSYPIKIDTARISLFHELVHISQNINQNLTSEDKKHYATTSKMLEREKVAHFFEAFYFLQLYGADTFFKYYFEKLTSYACPVKITSSTSTSELNEMIQSRWEYYAYFLKKLRCMPTQIFKNPNTLIPIDNPSKILQQGICQEPNYEWMLSADFNGALGSIGIEAFQEAIKDNFPDLVERNTYSSFLLDNAIYSAGQLNLYNNPPRGADDLTFNYLEEIQFGKNYLSTDSFNKMQNDRQTRGHYFKNTQLYYIARPTFFHALDMVYQTGFGYTDDHNLKIISKLESIEMEFLKEK